MVDFVSDLKKPNSVGLDILIGLSIIIIEEGWRKMGKILEIEREEDGKIVMRFDPLKVMPKIMPNSARDHLLTARRERLLAIRDFATETIDWRIRSLETKERKGTQKREIEVE